MVEQVIEFWKRTENVAAAHGSVINHSDAENLTTSIPKSENYPINIMSRNFSSWFYKNLNESSIQLNDFWTDCTCTIRMIDSSGEIKEDATITSRLVLNLLYTIKNQFNFFFNPNISHEGKLCQNLPFIKQHVSYIFNFYFRRSRSSRNTRNGTYTLLWYSTYSRFCCWLL